MMRTFLALGFLSVLAAVSGCSTCNNCYPHGGVIGSGREVGQKMLEDPRLPLVSFTGSTQVGRGVASTVSGRFGRTILLNVLQAIAA